MATAKTKLDDDLDALFRLPLAEFTGARNTLAAQLKQGGRRDESDFVKGLAKPSISAAVKSQDTTLTGWSTAIAVGDILRFNVESAATCQRLALTMKIKRT